MIDPSENSSVDEKIEVERREEQRTLSNAQIFDIQQRQAAAQEQELELQPQSIQPSTEVQPESTQPEPQPTGGDTQEPGFLQGLSYFGQPLEETNEQVKERLSAPGQGLIDTATNALNMLLPDRMQIPKATKYEDSLATVTRDISSVVAPTLLLQGAGMAAGTAAQAKVGSKVGETAFMKFIGARGVEAGTSVAVGRVAAPYAEGDNFLGSIKKMIPPQYDFIPDNWATLDTDSTDVKRHKNINEDLGLGFLLPFIPFVRKLSSSLEEMKQVFKDPVLIGETPQAVKKLAEIGPPPKSENVEEAISQYVAKQEADLDELGYYNMSKNSDTNIPMKGVHDLYDFREVGIRSVDDFGIVGASVDAARIAANKGTVYGRLGNFISEPALKYGSETPGGVEEITIGLTKQLKEADRYGMEAADWSISFDEVLAQGDNLVVELFDPSASIDDIKRVLAPTTNINEFGAEILTEEGYSSALRSISKMAKEYTDMDVARAQAYTATSMAGQIADLSEGIRLNLGSISEEVAKEKLLDKIKFFQQLVGSTRYYTNQKRGFLAVAEKIKNFGKSPEQISKSISDAYPQVLKDIQTESEMFTASWEYLQKNRPDILDSFLEMYEATDGKIHSIATLNDSILKSYVFMRPFIDKDPDAPNLIMQAVKGNYFNSLLSSTTTAAKALYGNFSGHIEQPISYFAGAMMRGKLKDVQRGWMAYNSIFDTQKKALPYAGKLFMKASQNPNSVKGQTRLDYMIKQDELAVQHRAIADAEAARGNHGFKFVLNFHDSLKAMESDPIFRLTPNTFTALDGWSGATLANQEARFRALDELERLGEAATPARIKEIADSEFNSMFGKDELIKDKVVKYRNADIALNLDSGITKGLNEFLRYVPAAVPILTFPTTLTNVFRIVDDTVPFPIRSFQADINDLAYTPLQTFMENPELMERVLKKRGYKLNQMDDVAKLNAVSDLKNRTLGKKGISAFITYSVIGGVLADRFFGDGLYSTTGDGTFDRGLNKARQKNSNWKARSQVLEDGTRIEYNELLGPGMSNWVATVANIADNFDLLGETFTEQMLEKSMFVLGAAMADNQAASILTPVAEMLAGNTYQINRFAAGQISSLGPLGGARNQLGQLLDGGLKEINNDIMSHIANRNQIVGVFDPVNRLPTIVSPVTGKAPNKYTFLQRLYNQHSPLKIHPAMSPEEKFLYDIEYDVSSAFKTRTGVELEYDERTKLFAIMGENGFFRTEIKRISKLAESRNTIQELKEARRNRIDSETVPIGKYDRIHMELNRAQKIAEDSAFLQLDSEMQDAIQQRINLKKRNDRNAELGIIPTNRY